MFIAENLNNRIFYLQLLRRHRDLVVVPLGRRLVFRGRAQRLVVRGGGPFPEGLGRRSRPRWQLRERREGPGCGGGQRQRRPRHVLLYQRQVGGDVAGGGRRRSEVRLGRLERGGLRLGARERGRGHGEGGYLELGGGNEGVLMLNGCV